MTNNNCDNLYKMLFEILKANLPFHSEEGSLHSSIKVDDIKTELKAINADQPDYLICIIELIERLLLSLRLLDIRSHKKGEWKWVSYPAQLMAFSLFEILADDKQFLFDKNFWQTGREQPQLLIDQQRELLQKIEQARLLHHKEKKPAPIRYVHVAWAIIKLDGRILFHLREDKKRIDTLGHYVPIGGRFTLNDFLEKYQNTSIDKLLSQIQSTESEWINKSISNTLIREVKEETNLLNGEHYDFNPLLKLNTFKTVEGSLSNHAYTEYTIEIFQITLSQSGCLKLFQTQSQDGEIGNTKLIWLTPQEVIERKSFDGKMIFIDALHNHFSDHENLRAWLQDIPESYDEAFRYYKPIEAIDIPIEGCEFLQQGKSGKETQFKEHYLTEVQKSLLTILAMHTKNSIKSDIKVKLKNSENTLLLPKGWIKVSNQNVSERLVEISQLLCKYNLPLIENVRDSLFRLNIHPKLVFCSPSLYRYSLVHLEADRWILNIYLNEVETDLVSIPSQQWEIPITQSIYNAILSLERDEDSYLKDVEKSFRDQIDRYTQLLGIRKFIRKDGYRFYITIKNQKDC
jgi:hypothetical protein